MRTAPLTTATLPPITSTVSALSDRELLRETRNLVRHERHLQGAVIDHLTEIEARGLYLERGFSSLFDYAVRELGYSDAAAARRIGAMRLCADQPDAREGLRDGSLTLSAAAELQWAFDRQVRRMLADLDPELAPPADRVRPLGDGRYELKATIDAECQQGLEQLRGLLSHVDPRMTMGQLVGRLVREALDRHDPSRPPRRARSGSRPADAKANAPRTPTPEQAQRRSAPADTAAAPKTDPDAGRCSYADPQTGRRCNSTHLIEIDHIVPHALGGAADPGNLRLLCGAHHRHRHAQGRSTREPAP